MSSDQPTKPPEDPPDEQKIVIKEEYDATKYQDSEMEKISADSTEEDGWTTVQKKRKSVDELNTPSTKRSCNNFDLTK